MARKAAKKKPAASKKKVTRARSSSTKKTKTAAAAKKKAPAAAKKKAPAAAKKQAPVVAKKKKAPVAAKKKKKTPVAAKKKKAPAAAKKQAPVAVKKKAPVAAKKKAPVAAKEKAPVAAKKKAPVAAKKKAPAPAPAAKTPRATPRSTRTARTKLVPRAVSSPDLLRAAWHGHAERVRELLGEGHGPGATGPHGLTPLLLAVHGGHAAVVAALLEAGAPVDGASDAPITTAAAPLPSELAATEVDEAVVAASRAMSQSLRGYAGRTPLMLAAEAGRADLVRTLLGAGAGVDAHDRDGWTALTAAAAGGHAGVVRTLLDAGASARDPGGPEGGPLGVAAASGHVEAVERLLDAGVDPAARTGAGLPPLLLAAGRGHADVIRALVAAGARPEASPLGSPLVSAVVGGHLPVVEALVAAGERADETDAGGLTPLHLAATHGHAAIVRHLARVGAPIDAVDGHGQTPLLLAVEGGQHAAALALLDAGAAIDRPRAPQGKYLLEGSGHAPLHAAAARGDAPLVRALLARGADPNQAIDLTGFSRPGEGSTDPRLAEDGCTALHLAAREGHAEVVRALLDAGAGVNATARNGDMPLVLAARGGHGEVVAALERGGATGEGLPAASLQGARLLGAIKAGDEAAALAALEAGADACALDVDPSEGTAPALVLAASAGLVDVTRALLARGARVGDTIERDLPPWSRTALHEAARAGHAGVVSLLLSHGADVAARDRDFEAGGNTPLHLAAEGGHAGVVEALLAAGAAVDARNAEGLTPLMLAAGAGHDAVVAALLGAGAKVDARCPNGQTALVYASQQGHATTARALLDAGADARVLPRQGASPLAAATGGGHGELVRALLRAGADPTEGGRSPQPLAEAVLYAGAEVLDALLAAGADAGAPDAEGLTALHWAAITDRADLIPRLLDAGGRVDATDANGLTPLMTAAERGHLLAARALVQAGASLTLRDARGRTAEDLARAAQQRHVVTFLHPGAESSEGEALIAPPSAGPDPDEDDALLEDAEAHADETTDGLVRELELAALADLRGIADLSGNDEAVLVAAPVEDVAVALKLMRGFERWERETGGREVALGPVSLSVFRLRGHTWTTVTVEHLDLAHGGRGLGEEDARELSARLATRALYAWHGDTAGVVGYVLHERGDLVERVRYGDVDHGARDEADFDDDPGDVLVESRRRALRPSDVEDPFAFVDEALKAEDALLPPWGRRFGTTGQSIVLGEGWHEALERIDLLA